MVFMALDIVISVNDVNGKKYPELKFVVTVTIGSRGIFSCAEFF